METGDATMKPKYLVGTALLVVCFVAAALLVERTTTPYVTFQEALRSGDTVQIIGHRVADSDLYSADFRTFRFRMRDPEGMEFSVLYNGVKPSNFEHASEVVVKGVASDSLFTAEELFVKLDL